MYICSSFILLHFQTPPKMVQKYLSRKQKMEYHSKNSLTNLAILSLFLISSILLCSWEILAYFSDNNSSNISIFSRLIHKDELQIALEKASMPNKTVIIAVINKAYVESDQNRFPTMFDLFLEGFWAGEGTRPLLDRLLVVSMDKEAHERCVFRRLNCYSLAAEDRGGGDYFAGEKLYMSEGFIEMMWRRTRFLLEVLNRGYSFIFTDGDVLWLRNPFTVLGKTHALDLEMSTGVFNGNTSSEENLINTGLYFIRSNDKTISLFKTWYDQRNNSPGLKEQDVLVNLVQGGMLRKLGIKAMFLDTFYFGGLCNDIEDVRVVLTVHATCCRSIKAKGRDLKEVLGDWKRFQRNGSLGNSINGRNYTIPASKHASCINSWHKKK